MKIECILRREGGTRAEIGGTTYHFKPVDLPDAPHLADIADREHIARFLSITEGYRLAESESEGVAAVIVEAPVTPVTPTHSHQMPAPVTPVEPATVAEPVIGDNYDDLDRDALAELYAARFGSRAPAHIKKASLITALRAQA